MMYGTTQNTAARWFAPETLIQSIGIGLLLTIVSRAAALGRGVLFARMLDREQLGTWAITHNTMQMLSVVLVLGIPAGLCRYAARFERAGRLRSFLSGGFGLPLAAGAALCLLGMLFCRPVARFVYENGDQAILAALLCLGALSLAALNLFQGVLQGLRVYRINAVMLVVQSVGFAAVAAVLFQYWRPDALAGISAFVLVSVTVTAIPIAMLWRHVHGMAPAANSAAEPPAWKPLVAYSLGTWGSSALFSLWSCLDRYMLLHFDTLENSERLEQIGTYHLAENLTGPLLTLGAGWSVQVLAHTVHAWESQRRDQAERTVLLATKLMSYVLTCVAAGLIVCKRFLLAGVFGDTTMASGEILELLMVATTWVAVQAMLRCYVLCHERAWVISVVWIAAIASSFGLNFFLIPVWHLKGAALAAMLSALVSTGLLMWLTQRSGLRLSGSLCASVALPAALLLPVPWMLLALAAATWAACRTDWLLNASDRDRIRDIVVNTLTRRSAASA